MTAVRNAFRLVRGRSRALFAAVLVLQLGAAAMAIAEYVVLRSVLGFAQRDGFAWSGAWPRIGVLAAVFAASGACVHVQPAITRIITELNVRDVNVRRLTHLGEVDYALLDSSDFHERMVRVMQSGVLAPVRVVGALADLAGNALLAVGMLVAIGILAPALLPLVVCFYVPAMLLGRRAGEKVAAFTYGQSLSDRERNHLQALFVQKPAAAEMRIWGTQAMLVERFRTLYGDRLRELRALCMADAWRGLRMALAGGAVAAATVSYLTFLLASGRVSVLSAALVGLVMFQIGGRAQEATGAVRVLTEFAPFLDEMVAMYDGLDAPAAGRVIDRVDEIRVQRARFRYPAGDRDALAGVSLTARRGEVVAIAGPSGNGKSTLLGILCGLYEPRSGRVTWDGRPVTAADRRVSTAVMLQDFAKPSFTVEEAVRALREGDSNDVEPALAAAGASAFVDRLPQGAATRLGTQFPGGVDLSVGEWQRLALARALWQGRAALVLDEPTSALDDHSTSQVLAAMRTRANFGPVIAFTHDRRVLEAADRIYLLERGRVSWTGSWPDFAFEDQLQEGAA